MASARSTSGTSSSDPDRLTAVAAVHAPSRRDSAASPGLWQFPLLLLSLGLFGYAAYLFIDPKPGPTADQKIASARHYLAQERPRAAIEQLNKVLAGEQLDRDAQGRVHLMLAEALAMGQHEKRISIAANHQRIIEQTRLAAGCGVVLDAAAWRRMGESYEALGRAVEALDSYRRAMNLDQSHSLALQRKVIDLQLAQDDPTPAELTIDQYLKNAGISNAERAWAMGEKAQLMVDAGKYLDARDLLNQALKLEIDPVAQGTLNYRLGYCAFRLGDNAEAERFLRVSRDQLQHQHPLDADAALLLGKICRERGDAAQAAAFFQDVLVSRPDAPAAPLARLGRGLCRIMQGEDDPGLTDLHDFVDEIARKSARARYRDEALTGLKTASALLAARQNYQGALEVLAYEQSLHPDPPPQFFARLGDVYDKRAEQVGETLQGASPADAIRRTQQVRELRTRAGDAYIAYSRGLTLIDDKAYGEALWRGIDLYDRAGNVQRAIEALELFCTERPDDPLAAEALLRLGQSYQAAGQFDKAIAAYQKNQFRHPNTLAASKSAVPLAQAYIAKGLDSYPSAERVLLSVIEDNKLLTPESEEFRQALFELSQLYYRTSRYEQAINRLREFVDRYPGDERIGQLTFLMADSFRKLATQQDAQLLAKLAASRTADATASAVPAPPGVSLAEAAKDKRQRLTQAKALFDRTIELYGRRAPATDIDKLYLKLSHFYRADCLYDLGQYSDAITLYDAAAFKYQDDPAALAAYVQIVNAYCAMGKIAEAKTANERAKWLLKRIPEEAFSNGSFAMPKEYWSQWLKWTSDAGMW